MSSCPWPWGSRLWFEVGGWAVSCRSSVMATADWWSSAMLMEGSATRDRRHQDCEEGKASRRPEVVREKQTTTCS